MTLTLTSNIFILSCLTSSEYFILWDSLADASIDIGADAGMVSCKNTILQLDYSLSLGKGHRTIRWAFTRDIFKCLLEWTGNASHDEFQGIQLPLKLSIMTSTFLIFHVSSSKSSVVDSMGLNFARTYISTYTCINNI